MVLNVTEKHQDEDKIKDQIADIISEGVFNYLKKNGLLKKRVDQIKRYQLLQEKLSELEKTKLI